MFPMEHRGYVNAEDKKAISWQDFFSYNQSYFWYNNTVKQFPQFAYDETTPDVQVSEQYCIHLWWKKPSREKAYDLATDLYGLPTCLNNAKSTKFIWNVTDPTTGYSFPLWRRVVLTPEVKAGVTPTAACTALGGKYGKDGSCYAYDILNRVCIRVDIMTSGDGRFFELGANNGCFSNGDVGYYVRAKPDKLYSFNYVPVEVRQTYDPYTVWASSGYTIEKDTSAAKVNTNNYAYIALFATLFFAVLTFVFYTRSKSGAQDGESKALFK